jgi:hypothetical protein
MLTGTKRTVLLLAAGILLFVVLCPATPTPTAVAIDQSALLMLLAFLPLLLISFALSLVASRIESKFQFFAFAAPDPLAVMCIRRC